MFALFICVYRPLSLLSAAAIIVTLIINLFVDYSLEEKSKTQRNSTFYDLKKSLKMTETVN